MSFWETKNVNQSPKPWEQPMPQPVVLDEQAMKDLQEDPSIDIFDEEDLDTAEIMFDANLRLEMGRLYQMVIQGDIFADTNADPKAIRNVQREIRKFVRERMETMLGIRQEQVAKETIVSSPFNDMEVQVLKMLASKMSKGETEKVSQPASSPELSPAAPKKDGITSISGQLRPQATPLSNKPKTAPKPQVQAKKPAQSAISKSEDETLLQKPVSEMTPPELLAYEAAAAARRAINKSAVPNNMVPHPSPQQLEMLYTQSAANMTIANPWRTNA